MDFRRLIISLDGNLTSVGINPEILETIYIILLSSGDSNGIASKSADSPIGISWFLIPAN